MPFTFSHPAAVLPLTFIQKRFVSATALVVGSITPDFEYFFRMQQDSQYSHTPGGIFWFDLPLGLLLIYLYNYLLRRDIIENLPLFLNRRFSRLSTFDRNLFNPKELLIVILSLFVGILSHIVWDKLTHKTVGFIDEQEHYTIFWEANSVVGAAFIAATVFNLKVGKITKRPQILWYWLPVAAIAFVVIIYARMVSGPGLRELGISAIVGFFLGLIITSAFARFMKNARRQHLKSGFEKKYQN